MLHGVYPEPKARPFVSLRVTNGEGFSMTDYAFVILSETKNLIFRVIKAKLQILFWTTVHCSLFFGDFLPVL